MENFYSAIITAAGQGKRMGSETKKQYLKIGGHSILAWTLWRFHQIEWFREIILVVPENDKSLVQEEIILKYHFKKVHKIVEGGELRQDSVYAGLSKLDPASDYVFIHDAVRPFVSNKIFEKLRKIVIKTNAVIPGYPSRDTIKRANDSIIIHTEDRKNLWLVQTPQVFQTSLIIRAYKEAQERNFYATDDAALVERMGYPVHLVEGSPYNIKITTPLDLQIAEHLLPYYFPESEKLKQQLKDK